MSGPVSDVWDFKRDADNRWGWTRQSLRHEPLASSRTRFTTFEQCVADARDHGYSGTFAADAAQSGARDRSGPMRRR